MKYLPLKKVQWPTRTEFSRRALPLSFIWLPALATEWTRRRVTLEVSAPSMYRRSRPSEVLWWTYASSISHWPPVAAAPNGHRTMAAILEIPVS